MKLGDFFVALGVKSDKKEVNEFNDALKGTIMKAAGLVAGLVGVSLGFREMVQDAISASMGMQAFEAETGLSGEQLNRWKNMAVMAGAGADAMSSSIKALQRNLTEIHRGGGNIAPFIQLGIDPRQSDPFAVMQQVMARFKLYERGFATTNVSQMGISPDLIQMFVLSQAQLKAFSDTSLSLSDKDKAKIMELRNETTRAKLEFEHWSNVAIANLAPALTAVMHLVERMGMLMKDLFYTLTESPVVFAALGASLALLVVQLSPVTAAITALLLLIDDLYVYSKGGDSMLGAILGKVGDKKLRKGFQGDVSDDYMKNHTLAEVVGARLTNAAHKAMASAIVNITQYINSTAPAQDVADLSNDGVGKVLDDTNTQTNNGGQ